MAPSPRIIRRQEWLDRINAVQREYRAAKDALDLLAKALQSNPSFGAESGWRTIDARNLAERLEGTYLVRLYAEFESGLREAWRQFFKRPTHPRMRELLDSIAAYRKVPVDVLEDAHEVRGYRNSLVHEDESLEFPEVTLLNAKSRLCKFFSRLPDNW